MRLWLDVWERWPAVQIAVVLVSGEKIAELALFVDDVDDVDEERQFI